MVGAQGWVGRGVVGVQGWVGRGVVGVQGRVVGVVEVKGCSI